MARQRWQAKIKRADPKKAHKLLEPTEQMRVCSVHFVDDRPTSKNPDPDISMGYAAPDGKRKEPRPQRQRSSQPAESSTSKQKASPSHADQPSPTVPSADVTQLLITFCSWSLMYLNASLY